MKRGKRKAAFVWWGNWTLLWVFGSFVIAYFIFIPLEVHPLHWLFSFLGGVVGYGVGLFIDNGLPPVVRFVRYSLRRMTLQQVKGRQVKRKR